MADRGKRTATRGAGTGRGGRTKRNTEAPSGGLFQPNAPAPVGFVSPQPTQVSKAEKSASKFKSITSEQAVLDRPEMYIGSTRHVARKEWHLVPRPQTPTEPNPALGGNGWQALVRPTSVPFAVTHIVNELISNVADNVENSRDAGVAPGECWMTVEGGMITITNQGLAMPIEIDPSTGMYIPEMCFGKMHAGSNLEDGITGGGANGIGATAMTISSIYSMVEVLNPVSHKSYRQQWANNMTQKSAPEENRYEGTDSMVRVTYILDHARFGYPAGQFAYCESAMQMFFWRCASLSFTTGIPVTFNGIRMCYDTKTYAQLYLQHSSTTNSTSGGFGLANSVVVEVPRIPGMLNELGIRIGGRVGVKMILVDAPRGGKQVGFANHIVNSDGGLHVKYALDCIKHAVVTDKLKKSSVKITNKQIKSHVVALISVTGVVRPDWANGQTKTSFKGPMEKLSLSTQDTTDILENWRVAQEINLYTHERAFKGLGDVADADRRGKRIKDIKGEDANWAGGKYAHLTELHIVEGDSGEAYPIEASEYIQGGKNVVGVMVLMGKIINAAKASEKKLLGNKELKEFMRRTNIKVGVDYTIPKNRATLRYGKLVMVTDADIDGTHITGLMLALIDHLFPSILAIPGYVVDFWTSYMRGWHMNGSYIKFYYEHQYNEWCKYNSTDGWDFKYYKGLGGSGPDEIRDDQLNGKKEIVFEYDQNSHQRILLAMGGKGKDSTAARMQWIREFDTKQIPLDIPGNCLPIPSFIDYFLRAHSVHSLIRHIPRDSDGLTEVQRKIVYASFLEFGRRCTKRTFRKANDFGGTVGFKTKYHHGESIQKSVVGMGQTHIGSNNVPLLAGKGRFGSIDRGGKHAAQPRYLEVCASEILPFLFPPELDAVLEWRYEEAIRVEPVTYYSVVPLILWNGSKAVSTGSSSKIYACHPLEVIDQFIDYLTRGTPFTNLQPWNRGFPGTTYMDDNTLVSRGKAVVLGDGSVEVTCLPVGVWNRKYREKFLDKQLFDNKIKSYVSHCSVDRTYFKIKGVVCAPVKSTNKSSPSPAADILATLGLGPTAQMFEALDEKRVKVIKRTEMNNFTLLNLEGWPVTYRDTKHIMESFPGQLLAIYDKCKEAMVQQFKAQLGRLYERRAYIQACLEKKIQFPTVDDPREREDVMRDIIGLGLNPAFYKDPSKKKKTKTTTGTNNRRPRS